MSQTVAVGRTVINVVRYLDQNGNPMLTAPNATPAWVDTGSQMTPPIDSLSVSPGGAAVVVAHAPGTDQLSVTVSVNSKIFRASVQISISPTADTSPNILGAFDGGTHSLLTLLRHRMALADTSAHPPPLPPPPPPPHSGSESATDIRVIVFDDGRIHSPHIARRYQQ